jgi:uncharacterized RDD family membrane protein YckC
MGPEDGKSVPKQDVRYVWDPQELTWVSVTETPTEEAGVEPAIGVGAEPVPGEAISEEQATEEGVAPEAEAEAVALEYKGVWIRLGAAIIDFIVLTIIGVIIRFIVSRIGHVAAEPSYIVLAYGLLYFGGFWWWRGQTPGKMIIGAKVIRTDGRAVGVGRAFLRYIFYLVPIYGPIVFFANSVTAWFTFVLPIVGLIAMVLNRQRRGIHDLIAGTCVINTRVRAQPPEEVEADVSEEADESGTGTSEQD